MSATPGALRYERPARHAGAAPTKKQQPTAPALIGATCYCLGAKPAEHALKLS